MARSINDPRLAFKALYQDNISGMVKEFALCFYLSDNTVELLDLTNSNNDKALAFVTATTTDKKKVFLKRSEARNLTQSDFVIGKNVVVFGRLLRLVDYLDIVTRQLCQGDPRSKTVAASISDTDSRSVVRQQSDPAIGVAARAAGMDKSGDKPHVYDCCYLFVDNSYFSKLGTILSILDVELGFTTTGICAGTLPAVALKSAIQLQYSQRQYQQQQLQNTPKDGKLEESGVKINSELTQLLPLSGRMVCVFQAARPNCGGLVNEIYKRISSIGTSPISGGDGKERSVASNLGIVLFATNAFSSSKEDSINVVNKNINTYHNKKTVKSMEMLCSNAQQLQQIRQQMRQNPLELIFEAIKKRTARRFTQQQLQQQYVGCKGTVVIIKPHIVSKREAGDVLQWFIDNSFNNNGITAAIDAITLVSITVDAAASFLLAPYRGILPDFQGTLEQISSGTCLAIHFCSSRTASQVVTADAYRDENAALQQLHQQQLGATNSDNNNYHQDGIEDDDISVFNLIRDLCGPFDPVIAKAIRPNTVRARYSSDNHQSMNAVHCCDDINEVPKIAAWIWSRDLGVGNNDNYNNYS